MRTVDSCLSMCVFHLVNLMLDILLLLCDICLVNFLLCIAVLFEVFCGSVFISPSFQPLHNSPNGHFVFFLYLLNIDNDMLAYRGCTLKKK